MIPTPDELSRRTFMQSSAAGLALTQTQSAQPPAEAPRPGVRSQPPARQDKPRRRIAVVTTAYHYLSHAYHICGRLLHGYLRDGRVHHPDYAIAVMFVDQPNHPADLIR